MSGNRGPTCRECGAEMAPGQALANTLSCGAPDFPGDGPESKGQTLSYSGRSKLIGVWKCPDCGHSFRGNPQEGTDDINTRSDQ